MIEHEAIDLQTNVTRILQRKVTDEEFNTHDLRTWLAINKAILDKISSYVDTWMSPVFGNDYYEAFLCAIAAKIAGTNDFSKVWNISLEDGTVGDVLLIRTIYYWMGLYKLWKSTFRQDWNEDELDNMGVEEDVGKHAKANGSLSYPLWFKKIMHD